MLRRARSLVASSAAEWDVPPRWAWLVLALPFVGAVLLAAARVNIDLFRFLTMEDGPIEWAQFWLFALGAIGAFGIAARLAARRLKLQAALYVLAALALVFVAGEEIAWGQRLLGLETPEALLEINKQDELTLHNIGFFQDLFNTGILIIAGIGAVAYWVNRRLHIAERVEQGEYLFVPAVFLAGAFGYVFGWKLVRFVVIPESSFTITRHGEWAELVFAFGIFVFVWLNWRRLGRDAERTIAVPHAAR